MKKKSKNTTLIQTRVPREIFNIVRSLAEQEGISMAAYVRRELIREYRKDTGEDPYA